MKERMTGHFCKSGFRAMASVMMKITMLDVPMMEEIAVVPMSIPPTALNANVTNRLNIFWK